MKFPRLMMAVLAGAMSLAAHAQQPIVFTKPITMVIPFVPGGSTDPVGRIIAPRLAEELGQPVVIENKPGVAGALGTAYVGRAAPDGYTILLNTNVVAIHPNTLKNPGYDTRTDIVPVTLMASGPFTLAVTPSLPVRTVQELIAYSKSNPDKLFYGTSGSGSTLHLLTELLKKSTGLSMTHVPYKGNGAVVAALIGGQIQVAFDTIPGSKAIADAGKVRLLAVTSPERNKLLPDVPTLAESGIKGFEAETTVGIFLPKGASEAMVQRYYTALVKVLQDEEVKAKLAVIGFRVVASTPDQFKKQLEVEMKQWAEVTKSAKIAKE